MTDPAALVPGHVTIPLVKGVDTKTDSEVLPAPGLLTLENASFFNPGVIAKDDGYADLTVTAISGSAAQQGSFRRFIEAGNAQLIVDDEGIFERSEGASQLSKLPGAPTLAGPVNLFGAVKLSREDDISLVQTAPGFTFATIDIDGAVYEALAKGSSAGASTIVIVFREEATGTVLHRITTSGNGSSLVACTCGTRLVLFWVDGSGAILGATWDAAIPSVAPTTATVVTSGTSGTALDAQGGATAVYIAYNSTSGGTVAVRKINPTTLATVTTGGLAGSCTLASLALDSSENVLVVYQDGGGGGVKMFGLTASLGARGDSTVDAAATSADPTCISNENSTGRGTVYYSTLTSNLNRVQVNFDGSGGAIAPTATIYGPVSLASRPVRVGRIIYLAYAFLRTVATSGTERVLCMVAHGALDSGSPGIGITEPVAWFLYGRITSPSRGGRRTLFPVSTPTASYAAVEYRAAYLCQDRLNTATDSDLNLVRGDWCPWEGQSAQPLRTGLPYIANAFVLSSLGLVDASFGFAPQIVSITQSATGSLVVGETYSWQVVYEYTLPDGTVVRSAPSVPVSDTITGGNGRVTLTITTPYARSGVTVQTRVFRTQAGPGANYNLISTTGTDDRRGFATLDVIDSASDASISANRLVYTAGDVLEAQPAPAHRAVALHQNRLFAIEEFSREIRYTRDIVDGEAPAWHANLSISTAGQGIIPYALISTSNGLWVLGRNAASRAGAIALLVGDGPDDTGAGSTYRLQRLETADVGPTWHRHAIATPAGIFFEDPLQGYHLLPAGGGEPVFVGAPIEEHRSLPDASRFGATLAMHCMQDRKEVRCVLPSDIRGNRMLVYHYDAGAWSVRSMNPDSAGVPVDAVCWNNQHTYVMSDSILVRQGLRRTNTTFLDAGIFYALKFATGWIRLADIAGLQKVWDIWLCGRVMTNANPVTVNLYYDGSTTPDTYTFTKTEVGAQDPEDLRLRIRPRSRKMERFRIEVYDTDDSSLEGPQWNAIRVHYGALRRGRKTRTTGVKG